MKKLVAAFMACVAAGCSTAAEAPVSDPDAVQVMVLATYHMDNPGADLNNAQIDPVTTQAKQAELEAVADALARFNPTAIAVERVASDQATMLDQGYLAFTPADLTSKPDERVQIAYRLASRLKLARVYAIDEQDRPGEPSYFPFEPVAAWASANGREADLQALFEPVQAEISKMEADQKTHTIGQLLARINAPDNLLGEAGHGLYMKTLTLGSGADQPGAVLNGRWYTRNAIIFAKLRQVAKPGDRIVVVYGSGHSYWLREIARRTPGFKLVDPENYLPR